MSGRPIFSLLGWGSSPVRHTRLVWVEVGLHVDTVRRQVRNAVEPGLDRLPRFHDVLAARKNARVANDGDRLIIGRGHFLPHAMGTWRQDLRSRKMLSNLHGRQLHNDAKEKKSKNVPRLPPPRDQELAGLVGRSSVIMLVRRPAVQAAAAITRYARPLSTLGTPRENWAQVCSCQFEPAPSRLLCCCLNCRHGWLSHAEPPSPHASQFGYETRCAAVVQVSDFAARRLKPISLPIVLGSTFELDDCAHGARLHAKREQPYADGDGYVYGRWGSPTNEGAARQLAALEGIGPADEGGCMIFSSGAPPPPPALTLSRSRTGPCPSSPHQRSVGLLLRRHGGHLGRAHGHPQGGRPRGHALYVMPPP